MRVLHVDSARTWRGGQNQVLLAARGMSQAGHDVAVACHEGGALEHRVQEEEGLATLPVTFRGDFSPFAALAMRRHVGAFRPDVIQLHDPHAVRAGLLGMRGLQQLVVATRRVDFPLRRAFSRWKYRSCGRVIAVSRAVERVLERDGIPAEIVRLVYEGVSDRSPQAGGRDQLEALGVRPDALVVGNVAALTEHKDHDTLIRAAALVVERQPQARFVIVGDGELRASLAALAASLGVTDHVVFTGFRRDIDRLMPAFDVFCLSSVLEGLGTSLLDAMSFSRAIVATRAGGISEAVADGETGSLVPPRDFRALAAALLELLNDADRRAACGAAGRKRFETHFTAERMVEGTLTVFEELLAC